MWLKTEECKNGIFQELRLPGKKLSIITGLPKAFWRVYGEKIAKVFKKKTGRSSFSESCRAKVKHGNFLMSTVIVFCLTQSVTESRCFCIAIFKERKGKEKRNGWGRKAVGHKNYGFRVQIYLQYVHSWEGAKKAAKLFSRRDLRHTLNFTLHISNR